MTRRGALLLEVMLALALFVGAGLAILALMHRNVGLVEHARDIRRASDIARSAMARIESGMADPASLVGPVSPWSGRTDGARSPGEATADARWVLEIDAAPSAFRDLTHVVVRARRLAAPGSDRVLASYSLEQLVRIGEPPEDTIGEENALAAYVASDGGSL